MLPPASQWPGWCWDSSTQHPPSSSPSLVVKKDSLSSCLYHKVIMDNSCWIMTQKYPFLLPFHVFLCFSTFSFFTNLCSFLLFSTLRLHFPLHLHLLSPVNCCFLLLLLLTEKGTICLLETLTFVWKEQLSGNIIRKINTGRGWAGGVQENVLLQWIFCFCSHPPAISKHPWWQLKAAGHPNYSVFTETVRNSSKSPFKLLHVGYISTGGSLKCSKYDMNWVTQQWVKALAFQCD